MLEASFVAIRIFITATFVMFASSVIRSPHNSTDIIVMIVAFPIIALLYLVHSCLERYERNKNRRYYLQHTRHYYSDR